MGKALSLILHDAAYPVMVFLFMAGFALGSYFVCKLVDRIVGR